MGIKYFEVADQIIIKHPLAWSLEGLNGRGGGPKIVKLRMSTCQKVSVFWSIFDLRALELPR